MTGSAFQPSKIRSELLHTRNPTHGDALVEEHTQVKGLTAAYVEAKGKHRVLEEAVQFIQLVLQTELRPPWLIHDFPQALPGGGVLSRFTRPQLLFWPASEVATLFGEELNRSFADAAESVELVLAGIVARSLYTCTELLPTGKVCMKVVPCRRS